MDKKMNVFTKISIIVQLLLTVVCVVMAFLYLFGNKGVVNILEILVGVNLIIIGINNFIVYKKKKLLIVYIVVGIFMIATGILYMLGVM